MNPSLLRLLPIVLTALLCQCGAPQPPQCVRVPVASRVPAESAIATAREHWNILANPSRRSEWDTAKAGYNAAVAKLFDQLRCENGDFPSRAAAIGTSIAPPDQRHADLDRIEALFAANQVNVRSVARHQTTEGIGIPAVGWRETTPVGVKRPANLLPTGLPFNLTAVLSFDRPGQPVWQFTKRWLHNDLEIGNTTHPLAADWTAPNAFFWHMCNLDDLTIQNVILPDRFSEEVGLYFLQPYDPEKIPLVLVHGLVSSPDAFRNVINDLAPEPWFRERYQVWLFNYPTGNPWLYSSMKFREQMNAACAFARTKGHDRNLNNMVIVAHSMGGLVTRSSVTDPGKKFYDAVFNAPITQLNVSESTRKLIKDATLYQPLKEPKRVVFLAVPHRGSPMANLRAAVWFSRLIRLPKTLTVELIDATVQGVNEAMDGKPAKPVVPNSISSLSPKNKTNIALGEMPLPPHIRFHSVIGDRGRGDTPDSSDGVVPYWSSHVTPVESEKIIPSNHSVPDHPDASKELERILKLHLQDKN